MNLPFPLLRDAATVFQGIVIEAIPFILIGVVASSFIHVYIKSTTILKWIPKSRALQFLFGPLIGLVFPVCECGNIPLARRMVLKKVPIPIVIGFLFSAPVFNPIVILATWVAFRGRPEVVYWRIGISLMIAFILSAIFSFVKNPEALLSADIHRLSAEKTDDNHDHGHNNAPQFKKFLATMRSEFIEMMTVLILGSLIASMAQVIFPREMIVALGKGPVSSVAAMMLLAAIVSICSNVDAFFALSYVNNFTMGSILSFLVFGPMIDIKTMLMMTKIFRLKVVLYLALLVAELTFLVFVFYNLNFSV